MIQKLDGAVEILVSQLPLSLVLRAERLLRRRLEFHAPPPLWTVYTAPEQRAAFVAEQGRDVEAIFRE